MKLIKYTSGLILSLLILSGLNSCELEKTNINPNSPTEVPANVLLPFTQEGIARLMGSTPQVMAGIFMQYYTGIDNHPSQVQIYMVNEALYVDWDWNDYYDGPMINLVKMMEVADNSGSYYYSGMAKVLLALCLGNLTSTFGDIPYSEALLGSDSRNPSFDSQESIYVAIQNLLDEGIEDLEQEYEGIKPGSDDVIYKGDVERWKMAAYALKTRYYMHLSKRDAELPYNPYEEILDATDKAFSSGNDDLTYQFGYSASEYNPFYSFSRLNYIIPNDNYTRWMTILLDPRKDFLFKKKFGVATLMDQYFTSAGSPVHMMTYHEQKFIEAEARLRLNENDPQAQVAFREAVEASINKITQATVEPDVLTAYLDANTNLSGTFEEKLKKIIFQKWLAMYGSIESWTDYRRTGYPVLVPNEGGNHNQNPGGDIPRRFTYPQTERLYNENFPEVLPSLQDRFWWDQD